MNKTKLMKRFISVSKKIILIIFIFLFLGFVYKFVEKGFDLDEEGERLSYEALKGRGALYTVYYSIVALGLGIYIGYMYCYTKIEKNIKFMLGTEKFINF